jgi:hypothetical protein
MCLTSHQKGNTAIVLIACDDEVKLDTHSLIEPALSLLSTIQNTIDTEGRIRQVRLTSSILELRPRYSVHDSLQDPLPSATKILEPGDRYIISKGGLTVSSPGFVSKSEHLYNAQQLIER